MFQAELLSAHPPAAALFLCLGSLPWASLSPLPSLSASAPSTFCAAQELLGLWGQPWHTRPYTWAWRCRSGPVCLQRGIPPLAGSPGAIAEHITPQPHKYLPYTSILTNPWMCLYRLAKGWN